MTTLLTPCPYPAFFTKAQWQRALKNGSIDNLLSSKPVVKLFQPDGAGTWLICSLDPRDPDLAFGLCDPGLGFPELGYVRLSELAELRGAMGLPVGRDRYTSLKKSLRVYCNEAYQNRSIQA